MLNRGRNLMLGSALLSLAFGLGSVPLYAQAAAASATKVDINNASAKELETLPGVGAATAKKIIAGRPYAAVGDLAKAGVSAKTIEKITPLVTVGPAVAAPTAAKSTAVPTPAVSAAAPTPPAKATKTPVTPSVAQTPPAPGMVWVNTATKVFHREGDPYYGKTKHGKFMSEADAVAAGYHESKQAGTPKPN
jgi:hypothetical protein